MKKLKAMNESKKESRNEKESLNKQTKYFGKQDEVKIRNYSEEQRRELQKE